MLGNGRRACWPGHLRRITLNGRTEIGAADVQGFRPPRRLPSLSHPHAGGPDPMRPLVTRTRIAVAFAMLAWALPSLEARVPAQMGGFGGGDGRRDEAPSPRVYFRTPTTPEAAQSGSSSARRCRSVPARAPWKNSSRRSRRPPPTRKARRDFRSTSIPSASRRRRRRWPRRSRSTSTTCGLETGLKLALGQLDLSFSVHPDGLLIITSRRVRGGERARRDDPDPRQARRTPEAGGGASRHARAASWRGDDESPAVRRARDGRWRIRDHLPSRIPLTRGNPPPVA